MIPIKNYASTRNESDLYNVAPHECMIDETQNTRCTSMRDVVENVTKVQIETLDMLNRLIDFIHPQPINEVPDQDNHCLAEAVDGLLANAEQILARVDTLAGIVGV